MSRTTSESKPVSAARAATISRLLASSGHKRSTSRPARNVTGVNLSSSGFTVNDDLIFVHYRGRHHSAPTGLVMVDYIEERWSSPEVLAEKHASEIAAMTTLLRGRGYEVQDEAEGPLLGQEYALVISRLDATGEIVRPARYDWVERKREERAVEGGR